MKIIKLTLVLSAVILIALTVPSLLSADNKKGPGAGRSGPGIAFNFVDVEIPTVIKFISEITGNNFLFDERIKGNITIIAPTKLSIDESFNLFTSVLSLKGFTIIPSGLKTYKIIPSSLAKQSGMISPDEELLVNEGYITKLIPLDNIKAAEALQFLRPIVSRDGHISDFGPRNMLLIVDSGINIDKIISILRLIDKPSVREEEARIHVHFLEHADATDLAKVLQGIIKDLQTSYKTAQRGKQKNGVAEAPPILSVTPDKATNALVIVAPYSDYRNIFQVIRTLDRKRKQVFVEAMIVEASIDKLKDLGTRWRAMATHKDEPIAVGGVGTIGSGTILDIINGLTGLSVGGMGNFIDIPVTALSSDGSVSSQTLTAPGFAALFSLNEFNGVINVLSSPQILTSDNEEAEILVGENVPFISQRERDLTTTSTVLNSIQRTDVGIKLKITPQITEGDYVKLDIFQEISAVKDASDDILITVGPSTTKRSTKTSVVVQDGRTVVIGGLMQEREEERVFKVPVLGDIPILELLFKFKSVSVLKTNLLVFLSPHVIKETPRIAELTEQKHKEFVTKEKFYRQHELLVKFTDDVSEERALEIITQKEATLIKYYTDIQVYHIKLRSKQDVEDAVREFSSLAEVLYAEPNFKVNLQVPPEGSDRKEPGDEMNMNKTGDLFYQENFPFPEGTDEGQPEPDVDITTYPSAQFEDRSLPLREDINNNQSPRNESSETGYMPRNEQENALPGVEVHQDMPAAEALQPNDAPVGEVAAPQHIQKVYDALSEDVGEEPVLSSDTEDGPALRTLQPEEEVPPGDEYFIQVGSWKNIKYAEDALEKLSARYPDIYMTEQGDFIKVRIPGTMSKKNDVLILRELREKYNLRPILVQKR